jgi:hypothetical protein
MTVDAGEGVADLTTIGATCCSLGPPLVGGRPLLRLRAFRTGTSTICMGCAGGSTPVEPLANLGLSDLTLSS